MTHPTLTEFLSARIAEDEAAANECLKPENLRPYGDERIPAIQPSEWGALVDNYLGGPMGTHCARWDPTRVLADCAAKRELLEFKKHLGGRPMEGDPASAGMYAGMGKAVSTLAAVYSDHPDFQPEWAL